MLALYRALSIMAGPLLQLHLKRRAARGKEDPARIGERFGKSALPRPAGFLVWLHAASVGESLSMLPLVEKLLVARDDMRVLVTTGTVTSAGLMAERLPHGAFHQYAPLDRPAWVGDFLDHWRPDLALWAESEFWPGMLTAIAGRRLPLVLVNGRISDKSFAGWQRVPGTITRILNCFSLCLGQTERDAERLTALGAKRAECVGNLKFAAPPLPCDSDQLARLEGMIAGRPRWLAASTHAGEEEAAGRLQALLEAAHPGLLTIVVPRHPERGKDVANTLQAMGLRVALRSAGSPIDAATQIYVADGMGELGLFYRLAQVVFMGKSLVGRGGQNPLEPARIGRAVVTGLHMENFATIVCDMKQAGAMIQAADERELEVVIGGLLKDGAAAAHMGKVAADFAASQAGVLDRVMEKLRPFLDKSDALA